MVRFQSGGNFIEWIQYNNVAIAVDGKTGAAERKKHEKITPTVGEGFGFSVIPMGYREANHSDEGYQRMGNLVRPLENHANLIFC